MSEPDNKSQPEESNLEKRLELINALVPDRELAFRYLTSELEKRSAELPYELDEDNLPKLLLYHPKGVIMQAEDGFNYINKRGRVNRLKGSDIIHILEGLYGIIAESEIEKLKREFE